MLTVSNLTKQFVAENEPLFKNVSFTVNAGERVGLIGRNGSGKTTLINLILGNDTPTTGGVIFNPPNLRIGYLAQGLEVPDETRIRDVLFPQASAVQQAESEVERLGEALSDVSAEELDALLAAYGEALEKLEALSRETDSNKAERMLADLELGTLDLDLPVGILSGGQKTRLGLAALLLTDPQLLILDEPTNHLDIVALQWLEGWLEDFSGGALIVSHDRTFLDEVVNRIVAIDDESHTARVFEGDYSDYAEALRSQLDKQWSKWRDQQVEVARMQHDIQHTMGKAVRRENASKNDQERRYAKKVAKRAQAKKKRLERYMDSEDRVDKPKPTWNLKLDFAELPTTGQDVVFLENLSIGYAVQAPLLQNLNLSMQAGERVVMLGANGQGKSTLIKTIIGELAPLAGRVRLGASVKLGYLAQQQEILDPEASPMLIVQQAATMTQTEARSFLHFFLFEGDDALRPVRLLSFGERARLMLALLIAQGANFLILDEPINHLDVPSREQFEQALKHFRGSVLAVVHDRYFVDQFATKVWHMEDGNIWEESRAMLEV